MMASPVLTGRKATPENYENAMSAHASAMADARQEATRPHWNIKGVRLHLMFFAIGFLIVCSRRPDAIVIPQFYAEDGIVFYSDAYSLGVHSLLSPHGGYFQIVPRLVALLAQLFPLLSAPLIFNLAAIAIQISPASVFLSSRFSNIKFMTRVLGSFIYLALPNSFEIHATLTNAQSHLVLLACLLLLAPPGRARAWKVFDSITLVLTALSSPMGILLLPLAVSMWWKKQAASAARWFAVLLPASIIQTICVLTHWHTREAPHIGLIGKPILNGASLGAHLEYLNAILGRQIFYSSLLGLNAQNWLTHLQGVHIVEMALAMLGLAILFYTLRHGPFELKLFLLFAASELACALVNPLAGPSDRPQWYWLSNPGVGNRYYFLPMLAFLSSLFWLATNKLSSGIRSSAILLLLLLPIGICRDWTYAPFMNFGFEHFARAFDIAPTGTKVTFPINPPGWFMVLTKH
jgi:hypothetical protein